MGQNQLSAERSVIPEAWMSVPSPLADASHAEVAQLVRTCLERTKEILRSLSDNSHGWSERRTRKVLRRALHCESFRIGMYRRALRGKRYEVGQTNAGIILDTSFKSLRHVIEAGRTLDVWGPPTADIAIGQRAGSDGDTRPVWVMPLREHAMHLMMAELWRAVSPCPPRQFGNAGGAPKLNKFLEEFLASTYQVAVTDFPECFFSLVHDQVKAGCPLPSAAMDRRILCLLTQTQARAGRLAHQAASTEHGNNPNGQKSRNSQDYPDDPQGRRQGTFGPGNTSSAIPTAGWARTNWPAGAGAFCEGVGVPPGSPLSVLVAEKVLETVTQRLEKLLPGAVCVLWSDNLLVLLTNPTSIGEVKLALANAARKAIGDFHEKELLRRLSLRDPRRGFRFCKRNYRLAGKELRITSDTQHFLDLEGRIIAEQSEVDRYSPELTVNTVLAHASSFNTHRDRHAAGMALFRLGGALRDPDAQGPMAIAEAESAFENATYAIYLAAACTGEDQPGAWVAAGTSPYGVKLYHGGLEFTDTRQLELRGLIVALTAIPEGQHVNVYTRSSYLQASLEQLPRWRADGFRRADGGRLSNRSLWVHIAELADTHALRAQPVPGKRLPKPLHIARQRAVELLQERQR